jgi:hypothetical protein
MQQEEIPNSRCPAVSEEIKLRANSFQMKATGFT